jgi:SulP family sulfate permease
MADLARALPFLRWISRYDKAAATDDLVAAAIVTVMLIPQSLAYALIAGLPPETGLYASIAPLIAYALFGTSTALSVGPVAVISLMTATAISGVMEAGDARYGEAALALAILVGLMLVALGLMRAGFVANFLSHPIVSAFISASGILIAAGQVRHLIGVASEGDTLLHIVFSLGRSLQQMHAPTAIVGVASLLFLALARKGARPLLERAGAPPRLAAVLSRAAPLFAVLASIAAVRIFHLADNGVAVVGNVPAALPPLTLPLFNAELWRALVPSAALIAIIAYVESVSVARTLAGRRRERIDNDRELIALGAANLAAGVTGGFPVAGGFARSIVNYDAGARTPAAGAFAAIGIAIAALLLTPFIASLPKATLAAAIVVAVLSLVDVDAIRRTFRYSRGEGYAMTATILGVFFYGVEAGVVAGVALSLALLLYRSSRPHYAIVGQVPGTEHFRNVRRHSVITSPRIASIRVDGELYFANARYLEDAVLAAAAGAGVRHVVLMCSAVNEIDASALETLEALNDRLKTTGVDFHLSEVKGPVMDRLERSHFLERLSGRIFLSQWEAAHALDPETFGKASP